MTDAAIRRPRKPARCSPALVAAAVVLGTWWAGLILVLVVDPLNLYSWGVAPRLAKSDYAPEAAPYLVSVVANGTMRCAGAIRWRRRRVRPLRHP